MTAPTELIASIRSRPGMYLGLREATSSYLHALGWLDQQLRGRAARELRWDHQADRSNLVSIKGNRFVETIAVPAERDRLEAAFSGTLASTSDSRCPPVLTACSAQLQIEVATANGIWSLAFNAGIETVPGWQFVPRDESNTEPELRLRFAPVRMI
jgi:hypothetical protein